MYVSGSPGNWKHVLLAYGSTLLAKATSGATMAIIISERHNYLFIHIPKTAGRSLSQVLTIQASGNYINRNQYKKQTPSDMVDNNRIKHMSARDLRRMFGKAKYDSMETFSVVRNPFDRLKSLYRYQQQRSRNKQYIQPPRRCLLGFNDFVAECCVINTHSLTDYLTTKNGDLIVSSVLKFESLSADFAQWSQRVIGHPLMLPTIGGTRGSVKDQPFTAESIELVRHTYARDFELFAYSATPPPEDNTPRGETAHPHEGRLSNAPTPKARISVAMAEPMR